MRQILVMMSLLIGLGAPWTVAATTRNDVTADDQAAIHAVVQLQLDALAEDDATSAFEMATSATRSKLGDADRFMRLVKEHYSPVYRHERALFSPTEEINGDTIQIVRLTDLDSQVWLAVYRMQRDEDGNWKIDGCLLFKTSSVSV